MSLSIKSKKWYAPTLGKKRCCEHVKFFNKRSIRYFVTNRPNEFLNDNERTVLLQEIKTRIKYLISDTEILLKTGGQLPVVAALYIHAVEEYGKYLYVKDLPSHSGVVEVDMENKFLKHNFKINLAKDNLPPDCFVLKQGGFTSSGFTRTGFNVHEVPDWQTRLTIFNTDLEDGRVKHLPQVNHEDLKKAIEEFKSHLNL